MGIAVKRVQKLTAIAKAIMHQISRGGSSASTRGAADRRGSNSFRGERQDCNKQRDYNNDYTPRDTFSYSKSNNGALVTIMALRMAKTTNCALVYLRIYGT